MMFKQMILLALSCVILMAQATAPTAKVTTPPATETNKPTEKPPEINTAKLWRLASQSQALRQQANDTPQAKAATAAEEKVREEQNNLLVVCGPKYQLGYDKDPNSPKYQDLICVDRDPPPAAAATDVKK